MSFKSIRQLSNEPIIIIEFEGFVTIDDVDASSEALLPLVMTGGSDTCLILDTTAATSNFVEMLKILQRNAAVSAVRELPFTVQEIFVGTHALAKFYADSARLKQFGGQAIPIFVTMEDALAAARQWIADQKEGAKTPQPGS